MATGEHATRRSFDRRDAGSIALAVVAAVVCIMVPAIVLKSLDVPHAATIGLTGVATLVSTAMLGWRAGLIAAAVLTFGLTLADLAAPHWIPATIVMVLVAVGLGFSALRGWHLGMMLAAVQFAVVVSTQSTRGPVDAGDLIALALVTAATTLFGVGAASALTRGRALGSEAPVERERVYPFALMLGVGAAITTILALRGNVVGATALMMTPIIVFEPCVRRLMLPRALRRGAGVVAGSLIAIGTAVAIDAEWGIYTAGAGFMAIALYAQIARWDYHRYVASITAAVVLLSGTQAVIIADGRERMVGTLLGLVIVIAISLAMLPLMNRMTGGGARTAADPPPTA